MMPSRPCLARFAVGAALALSALAASAAPSALSDSEMSDVYGRGLSEPALAAFGVLGASEQAGAYVAAADSAAVAVTLGATSMQELERQLSQQRVQAAATGMQATLKLAQTVSTISQVVAPVAGLAALPILGFPFAFAAPVLSGLPALENKH